MALTDSSILSPIEDNGNIIYLPCSPLSEIGDKAPTLLASPILPVDRFIFEFVAGVVGLMLIDVTLRLLTPVPGATFISIPTALWL